MLALAAVACSSPSPTPAEGKVAAPTVPPSPADEDAAVFMAIEGMTIKLTLDADASLKPWMAITTAEGVELRVSGK